MREMFSQNSLNHLVTSFSYCILSKTTSIYIWQWWLRFLEVPWDGRGFTYHVCRSIAQVATSACCWKHLAVSMREKVVFCGQLLCSSLIPGIALLYMAQIIMAVDAVHRLGYIHRYDEGVLFIVLNRRVKTWSMMVGT